MMRLVSRPFLAGIAILALLGAALSLGAGGYRSMANAQDTHHPGTPMMQATPNMPGMGMPQDFDLMFIDMMVVHHEGAIAMAKVALTEAEHPEIRTLAEAIIASQQAEIDQMTAWRDAWYPDAPHMPMDQMGQMMGQMMGMMGGMPFATPGMGMMGMTATPVTGMTNMTGMMGMSGMMDPAAEAEALRNATGPFDLAFLDMMIPHHQSAVVMAQVALQYAQHEEIRTLAQAIIDAQEPEIAQMQSWRDEWYGGTPAAGTPSARQVDVTLSEFTVLASLTTYEPNVPYRFTVTNAGNIPHEFMIMPRMEGMGQMDMETLDDMAVVMIPVDDLPPGASRTIDVTFSEEGQLELVCAVTGHYDAGMMLAAAVSK